MANLENIDKNALRKMLNKIKIQLKKMRVKRKTKKNS